jgi:hypothetical protein
VSAVDIIIGVVALIAIAVCVTVLGRQRYLMRVGGGQPVAVRVGGTRWVYGIGRYAGGEFRWYRAIGFGTRPTKVLDRGLLSIDRRRTPTEGELNSLPVTAVIVECTYGDGTATLAFEASGFTGFVSWLEASAPRT